MDIVLCVHVMDDGNIFVSDKWFLVFQGLATWLLSRGSTKFKLTRENRAKISKFSESMWKLTYYGTVEACMLATIFPEPWFTDMKGYYSGWPNQELKWVWIRLFYLLARGWSSGVRHEPCVLLFATWSLLCDFDHNWSILCAMCSPLHVCCQMNEHHLAYGFI